MPEKSRSRDCIGGRRELEADEFDVRNRRRRTWPSVHALFVYDKLQDAGPHHRPALADDSAPVLRREARSGRGRDANLLPHR